MNEPSIETDKRRRETRTGVIKAAKITFGLCVIDCIVLDVSPGGARVRTDVIMTVPDQVILRFSGGSAYMARLQWARGMEIGFAFEGLAPLTGEAASLALAALNALPADGLAASVALLRPSRFLDDPTLMQLAEDAEASYARFKAALKQRLQSNP
jgi:hypothetical protein